MGIPSLLASWGFSCGTSCALLVGNHSKGLLIGIILLLLLLFFSKAMNTRAAAIGNSVPGTGGRGAGRATKRSSSCWASEMSQDTAMERTETSSEVLPTVWCSCRSYTTGLQKLKETLAANPLTMRAMEHIRPWDVGARGRPSLGEFGVRRSRPVSGVNLVGRLCSNVQLGSARDNPRT